MSTTTTEESRGTWTISGPADAEKWAAVCEVEGYSAAFRNSHDFAGDCVVYVGDADGNAISEHAAEVVEAIMEAIGAHVHTILGETFSQGRNFDATGYYFEAMTEPDSAATRHDLAERCGLTPEQATAAETMLEAHRVATDDTRDRLDFEIGQLREGYFAECIERGELPALDSFLDNT
jgi:hypothetical protein